MTSFKEYQTIALNYEGPYRKLEVPGLAPYDPGRMIHTALGIATETLEIQEIMRRKSLDLTDLLLELGDLCWFCAVACSELQKLPPHPSAIERPNLWTMAKKSERYVSRIKAGFAYGSLEREDDVPGSWAFLPGEIFTIASTIGGSLAPDADILNMNLKKLRTRYPEGKFSSSQALARRPG